MLLSRWRRVSPTGQQRATLRVQRRTSKCTHTGTGSELGEEGFIGGVTALALNAVIAWRIQHAHFYARASVLRRQSLIPSLPVQVTAD